MLRVGFARSLGASAVVQGVLDDPGPGHVLGPPPSGEHFRFEVPATVTVGFTELVLPLLLSSPSLQPYVSAGVTLKRYHFGAFNVSQCSATGPSCASLDFTAPFSGSVVGAQFGVGARFTLHGTPMEFGIVDAFNDYQARTRHDITMFIAVNLRVVGQ